MSTELTLRKLSKLVTKIDARIYEVGQEATHNVSAPVVIHDEIKDMRKKVDQASSDLESSLDMLIRLIGLRVTLRDAIGITNQQAGVNRLVTELRGLEQQLSYISTLRQATRGETRLSLETLKLRIIAAREQSLTPDTYTLRRDRDTNELPAFTEKFVETLEAHDKVMSAQVEEIHDKLEQINSTVRIQMEDDLLTEMRELEILA
jgi:hypothetical protein